MSDLQPQFDKFIERVSLGEGPKARINSAFDALHTYLCEVYGVDADQVFVQGSVANGTAVEPTDGGEYDLDIVVVVPDADALSANQALDDLEAHLNNNGRYKGKLTPKKPCVRIQYADDEIGSFHVDVVPARLHPNGTAPLQAPRRDDGWHDTAPQEFTAWCHQQGDGFLRTVKALKRWRDEEQEVRHAIKSIVLQVLASQFMSPTTSDADRLATVLDELDLHLGMQHAVPEVPNPVLPSENLAAKWTQASFNNFKTEVAEAAQKVRQARDADNDADASASWAEVLGDDFPLAEPATAGLQLADTSHARSIQDEGWYQDLDSMSSISLQGTVYGVRRKPLNKDYKGGVLQSGWKIRFFAEFTGRSSDTVWWQVINTGGHARQADGLRGEFFKGRDLQNNPTRDQRENWEHTRFTGTHLIEAFLVRGSVVVARSGQLAVSIRNRQFGFRR